MNPTTTAVTICAYSLDRWDDLCAAVTSAADQDPQPDEILVVIDHNDQLLERARREIMPHQPLVRVQANSRKQGLSGARNTALEHVVSDIVVFLDDDAAAQPGWLNALLEPYRDPRVIAVGGAATPRWPTHGERPATLPASSPVAAGDLDWVIGCTYAGQPTTIEPVRNLMGCNMSFRRYVFALVGGFSEDLGRVGKTPLGCEETELCIRARNAYPHSEILFEPRALVQHRVSPDRLTWRYLLHRCYAEGVSKAAVSVMVGARKGLQSERRYAMHVLPQAMRRQLLHGVLRSANGASVWGGMAAIALALGATASGYVRGRLTRPGHPDTRQLEIRSASPELVVVG